MQRVGAEFLEWHAAGLTLGRVLGLCQDIYRANVHPEKADTVQALAGQIQDCFSSAIKTRQNSPDSAQAAELEEITIYLATQLFHELLTFLPFISSDMQVMLRCSWREPNTPQAKNLFLGAHGEEREGLMSGYAVDGGLPEWLEELITLERSRSRGAPRAHRLKFGVNESVVRITKAQRELFHVVPPLPRYWRAPPANKR